MIDNRQKGVALVIALVFSLLMGLLFSKVAEQIIQNKRLSLALREQAEQSVNVVNYRSVLKAYLQSSLLNELLLEIAATTSEIESSSLNQDFNTLARCSEAPNSIWHLLPVANTEALFYLSLINFSEQLFTFITLTCSEEQMSFIEATFIDVYRVEIGSEPVHLHSETALTVKDGF